MKALLDFTRVSFPCRPPENVAAYQDYKIRVLRDDYPANPWQDWDGQPPLLAVSGARSKRFEYGDPFGALLASASDRFLLEKIAAGLGISMAYFSADSQGKEQYFRDALKERYEEKPVATLQALCELLGTEHIAWESRGYAQGEVLECILVATPAWLAFAGLDPRLVFSSLASDADLFDAYAWGDVYEFVIENPDGEEVDGCGGYYGSDHYASGLVEDAVCAVETDLERREKEAERLANIPLQTA